MIKNIIKDVFKCKHRHPEIQSMTCYSVGGMKEIYVEYKCECGHTFTKNTSGYLKSLVKNKYI